MKAVIMFLAVKSYLDTRKRPPLTSANDGDGNAIRSVAVDWDAAVETNMGCKYVGIPD